MIPVLFVSWCFGVPLGYLAGDVFAHKFEVNGDYLPYACAAFPPLGAVLAVMIILTIEVEKEKDDE